MRGVCCHFPNNSNRKWPQLAATSLPKHPLLLTVTLNQNKIKPYKYTVCKPHRKLFISGPLLHVHDLQSLRGSQPPYVLIIQDALKYIGGNKSNNTHRTAHKLFVKCVITATVITETAAPTAARATKQTGNEHNSRMGLSPVIIFMKGQDSTHSHKQTNTLLRPDGLRSLGGMYKKDSSPSFGTGPSRSAAASHILCAAHTPQRLSHGLSVQKIKGVYTDWQTDLRHSSLEYTLSAQCSLIPSAEQFRAARLIGQVCAHTHTRSLHCSEWN